MHFTGISLNGHSVCLCGGARARSFSGSLELADRSAELSVCLSVFPGALELADVSAELPGLKWMPGVSQWKVIL